MSIIHGHVFGLTSWDNRSLMIVMTLVATAAALALTIFVLASTAIGPRSVVESPAAPAIAGP